MKGYGKDNFAIAFFSSHFLLLTAHQRLTRTFLHDILNLLNISEKGGGKTCVVLQ